MTWRICARVLRSDSGGRNGSDIEAITSFLPMMSSESGGETYIYRIIRFKENGIGSTTRL